MGVGMKASSWLGGLCLLCMTWVACASPLVAQDAPGIPGAKRFMFDRWAGPALPVWYLRPEGTPADAPMVFVMHGVRRDADRYLTEWVATAREHGFVIVVPEFPSKAFPGANGYNFGGVFDKEGQERPRAQWSYSAIEPIFDAVREIEALTAPKYWLFGHSAGAQFVHRYAMLGLGKRMQGAISANAGSYMFATEEVRWPFGVAGAPGDHFDFTRAFAAPLVLLLGDADNDSAHPSLPHQPEADRQGPHRFARGQNFYAQAREAAKKDKLKLQWSCLIAPGVAHENGKMADFAAAIITSRAPLAPGSDCIPARAGGS
jgi:poly(3-hydroxybutyrate) depolymerase